MRKQSELSVYLVKCSTSRLDLCGELWMLQLESRETSTERNFPKYREGYFSSWFQLQAVKHSRSNVLLVRLERNM